MIMVQRNYEKAVHNEMPMVKYLIIINRKTSLIITCKTKATYASNILVELITNIASDKSNIMRFSLVNVAN